jgi:ligand-binding sensor domain-containing protein
LTFLKTIPFVLCLLVACQGYSQLPDFHVQLLNESNGIQTTDIREITRDKFGYLWLLSQKMVQRFNGQSVQQFRFAEDLVDIAADPAGNVWISTLTTIKKFRNDGAGFEDVAINSQGTKYFGKLLVTTDSTVWMIANDGLYRYATSKRVFEHFPLASLNGGHFARRMLAASGPVLFFSCNDSLISFNTVTGNTTAIGCKNIRSIIPLNAHQVWASGINLRTQEVDFHTGRLTPLLQTQFPASVAAGFVLIKNVFPLSEQEYFVSTNQGCFRYSRITRNFNRTVLFHAGNPLADDNNYFSTYLDAEKTFWMIQEEGIIFFNPFRYSIGWLRSYPAAGKNWNNDIRAITEDRLGNLWLATVKGLTNLDIKSGQVASYLPVSGPNTFNSPSIRGLVFDGQKLIVGPTAGGIWLFDPVTKQFSRPLYPGGKKGDSLRKTVSADFINRIVTRKNGDHLVLAQYGIYIIDKQTYQVGPVLFTGTHYNTLGAVEDNDGSLWFYSGKGIVHTDAAFHFSSVDTFHKTADPVRCMVLQKDNLLWAGSLGLHEVWMEKGRIMKRRVLPQLAEQRIYLLFRDAAGNTWIGAENGLYRYLWQEQRLEWFNVTDQVQNKLFHPGAFYHASNGYVYLGGFNGLNYLMPEKMMSAPVVLKVMIEKVRINGADSLYYMDQAPLRLPAQQHTVEISFAAPYFKNTHAIQYRYRLKGLDTGWVNTGRNNSVRFSGLPAGYYSFRVQASLDNKNWYGAAQDLSFQVFPPFWATWWFRLLLVVLIIFIVYAWMQLRVRTVRRKARVKQQISELEVKALRAQMNPHFIFNAMNSIQHFTLQNDTDNANKYISKFSKLLRLVLHHTQDSKISLEDEIELLHLYLALEGLRMGADFSYQVTVDDEIDAEATRIPGMIIQPFVENAIVHGLAGKKGSRELVIAFTMPSDFYLVCEIRDNGIGMEKAQRMKKDSHELLQHKSRGIHLVKERLDLLSHDPEYRTKVDIADLKKDTGEPCGTKVMLEIPVKYL